MPASKDWRWHAFELSKGNGGLRERVEWLRFDFGGQTGRKFLIRDMRLIKAKPEFDLTSLDHLPFSLKEKGNQATVETLAGGGWSISTLGKDPFVMTTGFAEAHQPETPYILAFEYQAPPESTPLVLYFLTESGVRNQTSTLRLRMDGSGTCTTSRSMAGDWVNR